MTTAVLGLPREDRRPDVRAAMVKLRAAATMQIAWKCFE